MVVQDLRLLLEKLPDDMEVCFELRDFQRIKRDIEGCIKDGYSYANCELTECRIKDFDSEPNLCFVVETAEGYKKTE